MARREEWVASLLQICKFLGAEVTGACSTGNLEMVRSIGADHVIDHTREDFAVRGRRYDVISDCVGAVHCPHADAPLNPGGICVMAGELSGRGAMGLVSRLMAALVSSAFVSRKLVTFLAKPNQEI